MDNPLGLDGSQAVAVLSCAEVNTAGSEVGEGDGVAMLQRRREDKRRDKRRRDNREIKRHQQLNVLLACSLCSDSRSELLWPAAALAEGVCFEEIV